ncbi:FAD-dependent oxidoreductase [Sporosalibacterium faouarense]|uniref:FAD-dependent oxidoreductase n=1 Tax=Sporosalibacterium faouarense TaxID=516123 RepID=UPI00192B7190
MKVAIIGAGLSGLSCAYELDRLGIKATVFEKKNYIGDSLEYTICTLKLFNRYKGSAISYLKKNYRLEIKPHNKLKEIIMFSPNNKTIIKGNLGHIFIKSPDETSLENQILNKFKPNILFDRYVKASNLKDKFDYIVVATGETSVAKEYGIFAQTFNAYSRIATVLGAFKSNSLMMWIDNEYSKKGYAYLLPYNEKKAYLALTTDNISNNELDYYWNKFLKKENIRYVMTETRDFETHSGLVNPVKIDNVYFIGNSAGLMDSFMGFGAISSIESGFLVARSIVNNLNYNKMMQPIIRDIKLKHEYRIMMNNMNNKDFDGMLSFLNFPGVKQLLYKNPFYKAQYRTYLIKLYNKIKNTDDNMLYPQ